MFSVLQRLEYSELRQHWHNAVDRVDTQPRGAITASKTLLETTCKLILDRLNVTYRRTESLPSLFAKVANILGLSASGKDNLAEKKFFGGLNTIIQSITEIRNIGGDAHASNRINQGYSSIEFEAQLAVNLAGSATIFILSCFEAYLIEKERSTVDGKVVLKFDKTTVWRLLDHTLNSPEHRTYAGSPQEPGLWLVNDLGVYLMSNGMHVISDEGKIGGKPKHILVAYADGANISEDQFQNVLTLSGKVNDTGDTALFIDINNLHEVLKASKNHIILELDISREDYYSYRYFPDTEIQYLHPPN